MNIWQTFEHTRIWVFEYLEISGIKNTKGLESSENLCVWEFWRICRLENPREIVEFKKILMFGNLKMRESKKFENLKIEGLSVWTFGNSKDY